MRTSLLLLITALAATGAQARLTQSCSTNFGTGEVYVTTSNRQALLDIATHPASNPDASFRIYEPRGARLGAPPAFGNDVILEYDRAQDTAEIEASIRSDPVLAALGVQDVFANTTRICFSPGPPPVRVTVTEYFNAPLRHYFLSSSGVENAIIDAGGPARDGRGPVKSSRPSRRVTAMARPRSSASTTRGRTRTSSPWTPRNAGSCAAPTRAGSTKGRLLERSCPSTGSAPWQRPRLYRLYNNRWMFDDSNHRFVSNPALIAAMQASGWLLEGVALCLFN
jgi:hypothetical protein